jgi:aryl-alcohol dehydrogenase-like predicted oxidoreductase
VTLDLSKVSKLGFGVSGPHASHLLSEKHTIQRIREAVDLGVTVFDTAPFYEDGLGPIGRSLAEVRLGKALEAIDRTNVILATKIGAKSKAGQNFSARCIEKSLNGSLSRLKTDFVDILFLQGPRPMDWTDETLAALAALKQVGKIRAVGISGRGRELNAVFDHDLIDVLMAPSHVAISATDSKRIKKAKSRGLTIIGIEAMYGATHPSSGSRSPGKLWYDARKFYHWCRPDKEPILPALPNPLVSQDAAYDWSLNTLGVDCVLTLTTNAEHLRQNAAAIGLDGRPGTA